MSGGHQQFTVPIRCSHCGQEGSVVWEETAGHERGPVRKLVEISAGFHSESGRTMSGDPVIVCDVCDQIQQD